MITLGVTGGIGSGKSYICNILESMGCPVYYCDAKVKELHQKNQFLRQELIDKYGSDIYVGDKWNRDKAVAMTKANPNFLNEVGVIIEPYLISDIQEFKKSNKNPEAIAIESALFHKSKTLSAEIDKMIFVTAPYNIRMDRIKERDPFRTKAEIEILLKNQKNNIPEFDYLINNDGKTNISENIDMIFASLFMSKIAGGPEKTHTSDNQ